MFALTIKQLFSHKVRFVSSSLAVLLGVAFMAGTFVFTDTLQGTFDHALADANHGVDAVVRAPSAVDVGFGEPGPRFSASVADLARDVDGVDRVAVRVNGYAQLVDRDGQPVGDPEEAPAFGLNWVDQESLNPYRLASGHAPRTDDEIVVDRGSARRSGYEVGDVATVLTKEEPRRFTIAGIATFGSADSPANATAVLFTLNTAQQLLSTPGQVDSVVVTAARGVSQQTLARSLRDAVDHDLEVLTGAQLVAEDQASLREKLSPFTNSVMLFAWVGVFVGAFIINNTFSITVAQRAREMAMLRALGAGRRQVLRSVLAEAVVVGALASAVGLAVGIGVAHGLEALMTAAGVDLPEGSLVVRPGAMVLAFAVGVGVTVGSAWLPARRAGRVPPVAAMRDIAIDRSTASRRRLVVGTALVGLGVAPLLLGLGNGGLAVVGFGVVTVFVGAAVLAPVIARPVARVLGAPLVLIGVTGELATRNAIRNPKRTARTASSLMIGVALVGFMAVVGSSMKSSIASSLGDQFHGTHIVESGASDNSAGLSPDLADTLRATPGVRVVAQARVSPAIIDGSRTDSFYAFDAATIDRLFDLGTVRGEVHSLGADGLAVSADEAEAEGWKLGSTVRVAFPSGASTFVVKAIYQESSEWMGPQFVDLAAFRAHLTDELDYRIYVDASDDVMTATVAGYPSAQVLDRAGFIEQANEDIDQVLGIIYAMVALAVVIALLGIANTLALSIFERTRELGLLRSVGMLRTQLRRVVRGEAVVIAAYGTALGLATGVFFGWAIVQALADEGIDTFTVPVTGLVVASFVAAIAGVLAAVVPARRAARMNVLTALSTS